MKTRGIRWGAAWQIVLLFLLFTAGIITAGAFYYQHQKANAFRDKYEDIPAIADLKVDQIVRWRQERLTDARIFFFNPVFASLARDAFSEKWQPGGKEEADLRLWFASLKDDPDYFGVLLVGPTGKTRVMLGDPSQVPGSHDYGLIEEATAKKEIVFSDLHIEETVQGSHLDLVVPLLDRSSSNTNVTGTLLFLINPHARLLPSLQTWPTPSRTAEFLLVRREGDKVLYLNDLRHRTNATLTFSLPVSEKNLPAAMAARGQEGVVEGVDYRGVPVVAAIHHVPNSSWYLIGKQDLTEVYEPARQYVVLILVVEAGFILGSAVVVILLLRRQQTEADLKHLALVAHFDHIVKYANDIMLLSTLDGQIMEANDKALSSYGYTREEILQLNLRDLRSAATVHDLPARLQQVREQKGAMFEAEHKRRDGTTFPVEVSARILTIKDKQYNQAIIRDITERKKAEQQLRLQGSALESAANAIVITNQKGNVVWVNPAFTKMTGYESVEIVGRNPRVLKSGRHDEAFYKNLWETVLSGRVWQGELVNKRKDGSLYTEEMTITPVKESDGTIAHFIAIKQDVTERKRAEEKSIQLSHQNELILASAGEGIVGLDVSGNHTFVNKAAAQMLGYRVEEMIGRASHSMWHHTKQDGRSYPNEECPICATFRDGAAHHVEDEVFWKKDGISFPVEYVSTPIREGGKTTGAVVTFRDISQHKRADESLRNSNLQLKNALAELKAAEQQVVQQERLRALGTMASGIAHDFNNALAPILGFSELLLHKPEILESKERTVHFLEVMNTAARDAASVVRRLREFYRTRDEDEVFMPVDLGLLIGQAVSLTQPRWKDQSLAKGINIFIETDIKNAPIVAGIEADLREMLTNLIFNAVDAMSRGGTISIGARVEDGRALLFIRDSGTGMTEEVRRRCMEPFFSTKGSEGTGLGLSMVHGIVRRHEGNIEIESELGAGTTFLIRLPLSTGGTAKAAPSRRETSRVRSLRILLVEDEQLVREVESEYLRADGHVVTPVSSGSEALMEFNPSRFDVVITDRAMPVMSGDRLAITLKKISPHTPVILVTGFGDMMKTAGETLPGVDLILSKPLTLHTLREGLRQMTPASADPTPD